MVLVISCQDMGFTDDNEVSGDSVDELLAEMQDHAVTAHGYSEEQVHAPETMEEWRGAIRSSARPGQTRTPRSDA